MCLVSTYCYSVFCLLYSAFCLQVYIQLLYSSFPKKNKKCAIKLPNTTSVGIEPRLTSCTAIRQNILDQCAINPRSSRSHPSLFTLFVEIAPLNNQIIEVQCLFINGRSLNWFTPPQPPPPPPQTPPPLPLPSPTRLFILASTTISFHCYYENFHHMSRSSHPLLTAIGALSTLQLHLAHCLFIRFPLSIHALLSTTIILAQRKKREQKPNQKRSLFCRSDYYYYYYCYYVCPRFL